MNTYDDEQQDGIQSSQLVFQNAAISRSLLCVSETGTPTSVRGNASDTGLATLGNCGGSAAFVRIADQWRPLPLRVPREHGRLLPEDQHARATRRHEYTSSVL